MNYVVFDSETTNNMDNPIAYDMSWTVTDEYGEVKMTKAFVVAETFLDEELMASAYFIDKMPQYWEDIKSGKRKLARLSTIRRELAKDMREYNTHIVVAHNASFDYRACQSTQRYMTNSRMRWFFPFGTEIWDTLKMSREVMKNNEDYDNFCYDNGYITKRGCKRYTAEILYRFLTKNNEFVEEHCGLEDTLIEKEILVYCLTNGIVDGRLWK